MDDETVKQQALRVLKRARVFSGVADDVLGILAAAATALTAKPDTLVFRDGEASDAFYLIRSGSVVIERAGATLGRLRGGDVFGEMGALDGRPRTADAKALTTVYLIRIPRTALLDMVRERPSVELKIRSTILGRHCKNVTTALQGDVDPDA